jgi:ABC-type proline/glycine betaine transport system ATPase subunit
LKNSVKTVVLVTHDMGAVRLYCDRAILIENGDLIAEGSAQEISQEYYKLFMHDNKNTIDSDSDRWGDGGVELGKTQVNITDEVISISTEFVADVDLPPPVYGFTLYNSLGTVVLEANTIKERIKTLQAKKGSSTILIWRFPNILSEGKYSLSLACCDQSTTHYYVWVNSAKIFKVKNKSGSILRLVDDKSVIVQKLFKKDSNIDDFIGKKVKILESDGKIEGIILSKFGQSGKVKVEFNTTIKNLKLLNTKGNEIDYNQFSVQLEYKKYIKLNK